MSICLLDTSIWMSNKHLSLHMFPSKVVFVPRCVSPIEFPFSVDVNPSFQLLSQKPQSIFDTSLSFPFHFQFIGKSFCSTIIYPDHCPLSLLLPVRSKPPSSFSWIIVTAPYLFPCCSHCLPSLFSQHSRQSDPFRLCHSCFLEPCRFSLFSFRENFRVLTMTYKALPHPAPCYHLTLPLTASPFLLYSSHTGFCALPWVFHSQPTSAPVPWLCLLSFLQANSMSFQSFCTQMSSFQ